MSGWARVVLPYATYGIEVRTDTIVDAAPIAHWMIGESYQRIEAWINKRGGSMQWLSTS